MSSPWKSRPATFPPFLSLSDCGRPPDNMTMYDDDDEDGYDEGEDDDDDASMNLY